MADDAAPRRGDVWLVSFGPASGGEIENTRPDVVMSNDAANGRLNRAQVVPLSSQVERIYPAEALVALGGSKRKAMADQITTSSELRLLRRMGTLDKSDLDAVAAVVRNQLCL